MKPGDRVELTNSIATARNPTCILALAKTRGKIVAPLYPRPPMTNGQVLVQLDTVADPRWISINTLRLVPVVDRLAELS